MTQRFLAYLNACAILVFGISTNKTLAYEINNHADMTAAATNISVIPRNTSQKLGSLGLRRLDVDDMRQTFPLAPGSGAIPYCYGSARPDPFDVVTDQRPPQQDNTVVQPNWNTSGDTPLTIAHAFRFVSLSS